MYIAKGVEQTIGSLVCKAEHGHHALQEGLIEFQVDLLNQHFDVFELNHVGEVFSDHDTGELQKRFRCCVVEVLGVNVRLLRNNLALFIYNTR